MINVGEVRARYPEFGAVDYPDDRVQLAIDDATVFVEESRYGKFYTQAVAALAAHFLVSNMSAIRYAAGGSTSAPGSIKSESVGDVTVTYVEGSKAVVAGASYSDTPYGQRFEQIRRMVRIGVMVV